jgi:hypothetical protein
MAQQSMQELRDEFPRWEFNQSGASRLWVMRTDLPTTAEIKAGAKLFLEGDGVAQLRDRLREEELRLSGVVP